LATVAPSTANQELRLAEIQGTITVQAHTELFQVYQQLMHELRTCIQAVSQECVTLASQGNGFGSPKKKDSKHPTD